MPAFEAGQHDGRETASQVPRCAVAQRGHPTGPERLAWLAWLPVASTALYYGLPGNAQHPLLVQFLPQACGYLGLVVWGYHNARWPARLGLAIHHVRPGLRIGCITGLGLGIWNTVVILGIVPLLGGDIAFLKETPHARVPLWLMVPWGIMGIAFLVELNFRGFVLGRLVAWRARRPGIPGRRGRKAGRARGMGSAVGITALTFCFDPFMVSTFRHLHWIALWDGMIWGWIRVRTGNLYAVIVAHAVEVTVLYLSVRAALV